MTLKNTLSTQHIAVVLFIFTLVSCKQKPPFELNTNSYVIGTQNDILKFGESPQSKSHLSILKSSILIATKIDGGKTKFCSGVLMRKDNDKTDRILTNHHCFAITGEDGKATEKLYTQACDETTLYFGFSAKSNPSPYSTTCLPGSLKTDFAGDLATFALTKSPPEAYKRLKLAKSLPHPNTNAYILHYPDIKEHMALPPDSAIKLPEASITMSNCKVLGPFPKEEWVLDRTLPHGIRHTCDLIHGSSGSALINAKTSEIIGINWGGIKVSYTDDIRIDNVATSSIYAIAFLSEGTEKLRVESNVEIKKQTELASANAEGKSKKDSAPEIIKKKVSSRCGVIGSDSRPGLFFLLLIPITLGWIRRKPNA